MSEGHYDVCIVGAGASGLYAAYTLHRNHVRSYIVLEGDRDIGGRVKQSTAAAKRPCTEIGAEIIHGDSSLLMDLLKELNIPYRYSFNLSEKDPVKCGAMFFHNGKLLDRNDESVRRMFNVIQHLHQYSGAEDMSIQQFLDHHISDEKKRKDTSSMIDAFLVKTWGSDLSLLSASEFDDEECSLDSNNFQFSDGANYGTVIQHLASNLTEGVNLRTNYCVHSIKWDSSCHRFLVNNSLSCSHVIVTVPLTVLQEKDIECIPPIPQEKQIVIDECLTMRPALKCILRFKVPFWLDSGHPPHKLVFVSDHNIISQFWFSNVSNSVKEFVITGFTTGDRSEYPTTHGLNNSQVIQSFLDLIYSIYGRPSIDPFIDGLVYDWKRDNPFVRGGYSSPLPRTQRSQKIREPRQILSRPILFKGAGDRDHCMMIAGEAASCTACATVHGAFEAGKHAADTILYNLHLTSRL